ncbi:MAG: hypothetical protein ISS28_00990 [Candidatus Cloacimonetes bacterium]|nr:hypothetical protein [Candidatus Cloacimonadota bacterium]MBL7085664.1 hypothetical protein [Candidatus Cloacimonadota bacterium]
MKKKFWFSVILLLSIIIFLFNSEIYSLTLEEMKSLSSNEDKIILSVYLEEGIDYPVITEEELMGEEYIILAVSNNYIIIEKDGEIYIIYL